MIVTAARHVGRVAGKVFDEEDRKLVAVGLQWLVQGIALLGVAVVVVLVLALTASVAWSVFQYARF